MPEMTDSQSAATVAAGAPQLPVGHGDPGGQGKEREKARSLWSDAWHDLSRKPMFYISGLLILFLIVISLWPGLIASVAGE